MADLKTIAQAALASIIAAHPDSVVAVVANGKSASAIRDTRTSDASLGDGGELGNTTNLARVNADTLGDIAQGASITVAGVPAFVMRYRVDAVGATAVIEYQLGKPK